MFEDTVVTNFLKLTKTHKCIDNKKHKEMFLKNNLRQATYKETNRMIKAFPTVTMKTTRECNNFYKVLRENNKMKRKLLSRNEKPKKIHFQIN